MTAPRLPSTSLLSRSRGLWAPVLIVGLIALPELILTGADFGLWGSPRWRPLAYQNGAFWAGLLHGWQPNYPQQPWLMFLSYGFLHSGPSHLAGNALVLLWLGRIVAAQAGATRFLLIYFAAQMGGGAAFGLMSRMPSPMVGASGAIFGLAGAWVVWELQDLRRGGLPLGRVLRRGLEVVALLALFNLAVWWLQDGRLAWQTHLGGFLTGALAALVWPARR